MKTRYAVIAAGSVLALSMLAGCGKEAQGSGQAPEGSSSQAATSEPIELNIGGQAAGDAAGTTDADVSAATEGAADAGVTGDAVSAEDASAAGDAVSATDTAAGGDAQAPTEYETSDGFMGSFLQASDRDKIDTTNDYGVLYRVVYKASIEGDELIACGSMDYRNFKDQDPVTISSDVTHIFKLDENTVYQKQGEGDLETLTKEEFADYLNSRKDSGMYFEVEISGGVVKTVQILS